MNTSTLNDIASVLYSQVELKDIKEAEEENLPPGLALGCQQHGQPQFISWEEREKKGALKAMFSWKKHTESQLENRKKQMEKRQEKTKKKKSEENPSSKSSTINWNCEENIDHAVYRILTKRTGKKKIPKKVVERKGQNEGWRGRREEPSEIPTQRKKQVPSLNIHLINVLLKC